MNGVTTAPLSLVLVRWTCNCRADTIQYSKTERPRAPLLYAFTVLRLFMYRQVVDVYNEKLPFYSYVQLTKNKQLEMNVR